MTSEVRGRAVLHFLPIKENRYPLHSNDHRLTIRRSRAGVRGSAWTGFFFS